MAKNEEQELLAILDEIEPGQEGHGASAELLDAFRAEVRTGLSELSLGRGTSHLLEGCRTMRAVLSTRPTEEADALRGVVDLFAERAIRVLEAGILKEEVQGDVIRVSEARRNSTLTHNVLHLMAFLDHAPEGTPCSVSWLKRQHMDLFRSINHLCEGDWRWVKELLPASYRFEVEKEFTRNVDPEEYERRLPQMRQLAESLGDIAVAQILISMGIVGDTDITLLRQQIRDHLGDCQPSGVFQLGFLKHIPPEVLRDPQIERVVFVHLRDRVYGMMSKSADVGTPLGLIWRFTKPQIAKHFDMSYETHRELFEKLTAYWEAVVTLDTGPSMVDKVKDESQHSRAFPSLRQRVSVVDLVSEFSEGRQLNAFTMGKGKSACPFLAWEHLKLSGRVSQGQKLVLICPPSVIVQFEERIRTKYYKEGQAPQVGVVTSALRNAEELKRVMEYEVIIVADTMLDSERKYLHPLEDGVGKLSVLDAINAQNIGLLCVDEAHRFRNPQSKKASAMEEICNPDSGRRIPFIQLLSASPLPNRIRDMFTYIKAMYPLDHREEHRLSEMDPLRLRNVLLKCLLTLDPPEAWRDEVDYVPYELTEAERAIYNVILGVRDLTVVQKLQALRQFLLNPELRGYDTLDSHSLFDKAMEDVREDFKETNCVLIAHGAYKAGFTRSHGQGGSSWVEKVRVALGPEVKIHIIDGDVTDPEERRRILNVSLDDPDSKHVILCNADTIRLGISLVHIKRASLLENDLNDPETHQFVRRFNRAENMDSKIRVYNGIGTISEVIKDFAQLKAVLTNLVQYGGGLTDKHLKEMEAAGVDIQNMAETPFEDYSDSVVRIALMLMDELLTTGAYVERFMRNFNGKGEERMKTVLSRNGRSKDFAERYMRDYPFSYHGNSSRLAAAAIQELVQSGALSGAQGARYLDIFAGPMGLAVNLKGTPVEVHAMDLNPALLEAGKEFCAEQGVFLPEGQVHVGGMSDIKESFEPESLDLINLNLCVNIPSNLNKINLLLSANSRLKNGGVLMLSLPYYAGTRSERERFVATLAAFGFEVESGLTGNAEAGTEDAHFEAFMIVARKVASVRRRPNVEADDLQLRLHDRNKMTARQRAARQAIYADHHQFTLNGRELNLPRGNSDAMLRYAEVRRLVDVLGQRLQSLAPSEALSTNDIPGHFAHLGAQVHPIFMESEVRWYLTVPSNGPTPTVLPISSGALQ